MITGASALALLDSGALLPAVNAPAKAVYSSGGGQAIAPADIGAPALSSGRVADTQAPLKATYATGGNQALAPADIGAPALSSGRVADTQAPLKATYSSGGNQALAPADIGAIASSTLGQANGTAQLDGASKVVQNPASKGQASGIAELDGQSKVVQNPASKGAANGLAELDGASRLPAGQLPTTAIVADGSVAMTGVLSHAGTKLKIAPIKTANYDVGATDDVIPFDCSAGTPGMRTSILPSGTAGDGRRVSFTKEDAGANVVRVTANLNGAGADDTINGVATFDLTVQFESATFVNIAPNKWRVF